MVAILHTNGVVSVLIDHDLGLGDLAVDNSVVGVVDDVLVVEHNVRGRGVQEGHGQQAGGLAVASKANIALDGGDALDAGVSLVVVVLVLHNKHGLGVGIHGLGTTGIRVVVLNGSVAVLHHEVGLGEIVAEGLGGLAQGDVLTGVVQLVGHDLAFFELAVGVVLESGVILIGVEGLDNAISSQQLNAVAAKSY